MLIVIVGFIAAVAGSLLVGYSFGLRAGTRKHSIAKDMRIAELEATQAGYRSEGAAAERIPLVEPTTDHERAIAQAVDEKFPRGNPEQPTLRDYLDISASIDFVMSASDSQFLVDYLNWRRSSPARPSNSD